MRKLSASYIFPISSKPIKDGVVIIDDKGMVLDISDERKGLENVEVFNGIICPGFVNTHCHLELSHLRGKLPERQGLADFLISLFYARGADEEVIKQGMKQAEQEMTGNGIVAVGDISNETISFAQKADNKLIYHTFIETFGFQPEQADAAFTKAMGLYNELTTKYGLEGSVTPHAPYSVSEKLFSMINDFALKSNCIFSIHNQECEDEDIFFKKGTGKLLKLFKRFDIDVSLWKPSGRNSLASTVNHLSGKIKTLLVHNTATTAQDIELAENYFNRLYWCFCPQANLYIESHLPCFNLFIDAGVKITIGTDSLASNRSLSILNELKTITNNAPQVNLEQLLCWATKNGAEFLGLDDKLGTIEKGKLPGIILIENVDMENLQLTMQSCVRRIY